MSQNMVLILSVFASYFIGSIPTSIIVGKWFYNVDIRTKGSGNAGATNTFRILGWKPALFVAVFDIFKGWVPTVLIANSIYIFQPLANYSLVQIILGTATVLGHNYTIFAGFRGGKGVATLAGMMIALFPVALPLCLLVFLFVLLSSGIVALSSISAAFSFPIFTYFLPKWVGTIQEAPEVLFYFSLIAPIFILFSHRSNVKRMIMGTENKFEKAKIINFNNPTHWLIVISYVLFIISYFMPAVKLKGELVWGDLLGYQTTTVVAVLFTGMVGSLQESGFIWLGQTLMAFGLVSYNFVLPILFPIYLKKRCKYLKLLISILCLMPFLTIPAKVIFQIQSYFIGTYFWMASAVLVLAVLHLRKSE